MEEAWSSLEGVVALLCDAMSSSKGLTFPSSGSCSGGVVECGLGNLLESEQEVGGATKVGGGAIGGLIADITVLKGERGRKERRGRRGRREREEGEEGGGGGERGRRGRREREEGEEREGGERDIYMKLLYVIQHVHTTNVYMYTCTCE